MKKTKSIPKFPLAWIVGWFGVAVWMAIPPFDLNQSLSSPSFQHWLGTDVFGRDLLKLTLNASKTSALFAITVTIITSILGVILGAGMAFLPERLSFYLERTVDFFLAFPGILLAMSVQAFLGSGFKPLAISIFIGLLPGMIRYISVQAKEVILEDYVQAGWALGSSRSGILFRHLLPNLLRHLSIKFPFLFASALLMEATLSFLNLGVPPGIPTWGSLLAHGKDYLIEAPRIAFGVGLPLVLTLLSLQMLTDRTQNTRQN